jgi:hypothetical protein
MTKKTVSRQWTRTCAGSGPRLACPQRRMAEDAGRGGAGSRRQSAHPDDPGRDKAVDELCAGEPVSRRGNDR